MHYSSIKKRSETEKQLGIQEETPTIPYGLRLLYYVLSTTLIVSCYTLYSNYSGRGTLLRLAAFVLLVIISLVNWSRLGVSTNILALELAWISLLLIVYATVTFITGSSGGRVVALFFCILMISPFFLYTTYCLGQMTFFAESFSNIMAVIASTSLVLWLLGPIFGVLSVNCVVPNTWNGTGNLMYSPGYFHLLYIVQTTDFNGLNIVRNTSFFVEGPMYSYALCCAILLEGYFGKHRLKVEIILGIAVITSVTITGVLFLIGYFSLKYFRGIGSIESRQMRMLKYLVFAIVAALAVYLGFELLFGKLESGGGMTRIDDFNAGYRVWIRHPIFGVGFGEWDMYQDYISSFRSHNIGYSNSIMPILMGGGVIFAIPHIICFLTMLVTTRSDMREFSLLYLFIWAITIIWNLPLNALMLGFGILNIAKAEEAKEQHVRNSDSSSLINNPI